MTILQSLSVHFYTTFSAVLGAPGDIGYQGVDNTDAAATSLLNTFFFWAGIVAMIVLIIASFIYVTSQGDASKVTQAKNAILGAIIGIILIIMSAAIFNFVVGLAG